MPQVGAASEAAQVVFDSKSLLGRAHPLPLATLPALSSRPKTDSCFGDGAIRRGSPGNGCSDRDDDTFLAYALAAETGLIASGDKALLRASGYQGITVLSPRQHVDTFLRHRESSARQGGENVPRTDRWIHPPLQSAINVAWPRIIGDWGGSGTLLPVTCTL